MLSFACKMPNVMLANKEFTLFPSDKE